MEKVVGFKKLTTIGSEGWGNLTLTVAVFLSSLQLPTLA